MTTREKVLNWWRGHEVWFAVLALGLIMFIAGYSTALIRIPALTGELAEQHAGDMLRQADAYRSALDAKDQLIALLSKNIATTTQAAGQAAQAAAQAVTQADQESQDAKKTVQQHQQTLKGLK